VTVTAPATDTLRFPGQYYQLEDGLAYNWHRSYDASLGRYTQPDPLGFVDGPSLYGYAGQSPLMKVDPDGRMKRGPMSTPQPPPGPAQLCNSKQYCIDRCTDLALPTKDYGISFFRCILACESGGNSGFPEWDRKF
jgi:RHS repeat-associated protein